MQLWNAVLWNALMLLLSWISFKSILHSCYNCSSIAVSILWEYVSICIVNPISQIYFSQIASSTPLKYLVQTSRCCPTFQLLRTVNSFVRLDKAASMSPFSFRLQAVASAHTWAYCRTIETVLQLGESVQQPMLVEVIMLYQQTSMRWLFSKT